MYIYMTFSVKRVAWLLTHGTLFESEAPVLISLGFEIFVPKITIGINLSEDYFIYDDTLTIPKDIQIKLNKVNFYSVVNQEIIDIINTYFDICFVDLLVLN